MNVDPKPGQVEPELDEPVDPDDPERPEVEPDDPDEVVEAPPAQRPGPDPPARRPWAPTIGPSRTRVLTFWRWLCGAQSQADILRGLAPLDQSWRNANLRERRW